MPRMVSRTIVGMSAYALVVTSPATCTWPVVMSVSTATRLRGSCASRASRMPSLIWSAILSGWPSVTDSDVNRRRATVLLRKVDGGCSRGSVVTATPIHVRGLCQCSGCDQPIFHQIPHGVGHVRLRTLTERDYRAVCVEDGHGVGLGAEDAVHTDLVDDDQVGVLARELLAGVRHGVVRLGGEGDEDLAGGLAGAEFGGDVRI